MHTPALAAVHSWGDDAPAVQVGARDPETGRVPVRLPAPRVSNPGFLGDLLAEWRAEEIAAAEALLADTHAAADAAEAAARGFSRGLVSVEALICASDRAFHAARRAERAAEASGCPLMAAAAERARAAYRAGAPC